MNIITKNTKPKFIFFVTCILTVALINEFTLVFFDKNPPLAFRILIGIRIFDLIIISFGVFSIFYSIKSILIKIMDIQKRFLKFFGNSISLILFYLVVIIFLDIGLGFFGFGYPSHFTEEKYQRSPSPYDYFNGKASVLDHNKLGFRGKFDNQINLDKNVISIALFGGSTSYNGTPPISDLIQKKLEERNYKVVSYNFSSVSSSHTQHIHRLIKYINKYKFDFVVFFGGANETGAYAVYDPRIGYPYNFYVVSEIDLIGRMLLKYSNIIGEIDKHTNIISGLDKLKKEYIDLNPDWYQSIFEKYEEDLNLASDIVTNLAVSNYCRNSNFISITQPGNNRLLQNTNAYKKLWEDLQKYSINRGKVNLSHLDLTYMSNELDFIEDDYFHFSKESSRRIVADEIFEFLLPKIDQCK